MNLSSDLKHTSGSSEIINTSLGSSEPIVFHALMLAKYWFCFFLQITNNSKTSLHVSLLWTKTSVSLNVITPITFDVIGKNVPTTPRTDMRRLYPGRRTVKGTSMATILIPHHWSLDSPRDKKKELLYYRHCCPVYLTESWERILKGQWMLIKWRNEGS